MFWEALVAGLLPRVKFPSQECGTSTVLRSSTASLRDLCSRNFPSCWGSLSSSSIGRFPISQVSEFTRRYDFLSIFCCSSSAASCTSSSKSSRSSFSIFWTLFPSSRNTFAPSQPTLRSSLRKTCLFSAGAYASQKKVKRTQQGIIRKLAEKKYLNFRKYASMHSHDHKCAMPQSPA